MRGHGLIVESIHPQLQVPGAVELVHEAIRVGAEGVSGRGVLVTVRRCGAGRYGGFCALIPDHCHGLSKQVTRLLRPTTRYVIEIALGDISILPLPQRELHGVKVETRTWLEVICAISAHEFKHVEQFREGMIRGAGRISGHTRERQARAAEAAALRRYRVAFSPERG